MRIGRRQERIGKRQRGDKRTGRRGRGVRVRRDRG